MRHSFCPLNKGNFRIQNAFFKLYCKCCSKQNLGFSVTDIFKCYDASYEDKKYYFGTLEIFMLSRHACHTKTSIQENGSGNLVVRVIRHSENKNVMQLTPSESEVKAAVQ